MRLLLAPLLALPVPGIADTLQCDFTTECFEAEACTETLFELTLSADETGESLLVTDAETVSGIASKAPGNVLFFNGNNESGSHLLTATQTDARYSVQFYTGPMVVSYFGRCEEAS